MIWLILIPIVLAAIYWLFMSPYSQVFGRYPYKKKTTKKVVALTFDDGPNEPYTSDLLDVFKANDVKATFFQVGKCVQRHPEITKRAYAEGHTIANHSLNHKFHKPLIHPNFDAEIEETQRIIQKTIGKTPALFRSPWLWRQPMLLRNARKHGLRPISGVFCDDLEVFVPNADRIAKTALKRIKPGSIIIFHDGQDSKGGDRSASIEAAKIVVNTLKPQGYKFITVDNLLNVNSYN